MRLRRAAAWTSCETPVASAAQDQFAPSQEAFSVTVSQEAAASCSACCGGCSSKHDCCSADHSNPPTQVQLVAAADEEARTGQSRQAPPPAEGLYLPEVQAVHESVSWKRATLPW